jgi:hypothetical protein
MLHVSVYTCRASKASPKAVRFLTKNAYPKQSAEQKKLLRPFNVPRMVYTEMCNTCNGYFGSREMYDASGNMQSYSMFKHVDGHTVCDCC